MTTDIILAKTFSMIDLIAKKRNKEAHSPEEIKFIIDGIKNETIPDYQISAWLMAVYLNGMSIEESSILTECMAHSGDVLDLSQISKYVIDKHSTGGVGDKTSLILIPLLASTGLPVAKLSGRGLGYTGGTIDKLESIPGFRTALDLEEFFGQIKNFGVAIACHTNCLAPADSVLYALRDVTSTIESIPLISASILSKKIAAGANVIILDVKCGQGAFMKSLEDAEKLAKTMVEIGKRLNKSITAVITQMEQPLGNAVGNSLEVIESIQTLKNQGPEDLTELCLYLGAIALVKANAAQDIDSAKKILRKHLENGSAYEKFKQIIKIQGGDINAVENPEGLVLAKHLFELKAEKTGYVEKIDALSIAKACKNLGAGREKKGDKIDYSVGILLNKKIGNQVNTDNTLASIYANSESSGQEALNQLNSAFKISDTPPEKIELIYEIIE